MSAARIAILCATIAVASVAHAAGYCGYAYRFADGAQAKVRLRRYRAGDASVDARLVCTKWRTICNGRVGKVHASIGTIPGTTAPALQGTLQYGTRLVCGVYCQVDGTVDSPNMLFCRFNCPSGSAVELVSFTVGPDVCQ